MKATVEIALVMPVSCDWPASPQLWQSFDSFFTESVVAGCEHNPPPSLHIFVVVVAKIDHVPRPAMDFMFNMSDF